MSDPLLQIRNHHAAASGDPPIVSSDDPNVYIGYFQNAAPRQNSVGTLFWIAEYSEKTRACGHS